MSSKITTLMIGVILLAVFVTAFGFLKEDVQEKYGGVEGDIDINFTSYNKISYMQDETEKLKDSVETAQSGWIGSDIIDFFKGAYDSVMLIKGSYQAVDDITDTAIQNTNMGGMGTVLKTAISLIVLIMIFIGIILAVLVKRDVL